MSKKKFPRSANNIVENNNNKEELLSLIEPSLSSYEIALFKKKIMWKATIFAMKIVIPVVILALILLKFNS
ncbi:hypothetical protein LBMAG18_02830 [Alphaproteobacteria bacterium]|nr:hypothetical protein LBMAG18_02830 [Alphaproteobacteria bacterium]